MQEKKSSRPTWLPYVLVLLAALLAIYIIDLDDLFNILRDIRWETFVLGAVSMIIGLILITVRWRYLLNNSVGFLKIFHSDSISYMIRMFTPIFVPVLRMVTLTMTTPLTVSQTTPGLMAERLMEFIMRLLAIILSIILVSTSGITTGWIILWALVLALIFFGLERLTSHAGEYMPRLTAILGRLPRLNQERLREPMQELGEGLKTVGTKTRLAFTLLYSLIMWGTFLIAQVLLLDAVRINLNTQEALAISAVILVVLPPSTPAMIGVYQSVMVALLAPFEIADGNRLLAYSIVVFGVQVIFWVATGLWCLSRTHLNVRELIKLPGLKSDKDDEPAVKSRTTS